MRKKLNNKQVEEAKELASTAVNHVIANATRVLQPVLQQANS